MKKTLILLTVLTTLAFTGVVQAEQNFRRGGPEGGKRHGQQGDQKGDRSGMLLKWLMDHKEKAATFGITDEQVKLLEEAFYSREKETIQLRATQQMARLDLRRAMDQDAPSEEVVMALVDKAGGADIAIKKSEIRLKLAVVNIVGRETLDTIKKQIRSKYHKQRRDGKKGSGEKNHKRSQDGRRADRDSELNKEEVVFE